jgi:hypothetical protein
LKARPASPEYRCTILEQEKVELAMSERNLGVNQSSIKDTLNRGLAAVALVGASLGVPEAVSPPDASASPAQYTDSLSYHASEDSPLYQSDGYIFIDVGQSNGLGQGVEWSVLRGEPCYLTSEQVTLGGVAKPYDYGPNVVSHDFLADTIGSVTVNAVCRGIKGSNFVALTPTPDGKGYWMVKKDGQVEAFGDAEQFGNWKDSGPVVGIIPTDNQGYDLVGKDGQVEAFGAAQNLGSWKGPGSIIGATGTAAKRDGYWLVSNKGKVEAFGEGAHSYGSWKGPGSVAGIALMAETWSYGLGYWIAASSGKVESFGSAKTGHQVNLGPSNPVVSIDAASYADDGYRLATQNGNVLDFGGAGYFGTPHEKGSFSPIDFITEAGTNGYWVVAQNGTVFGEGSALNYGNGY